MLANRWLAGVCFWVRKRIERKGVWRGVRGEGEKRRESGLVEVRQLRARRHAWNDAHTRSGCGEYVKEHGRSTPALSNSLVIDLPIRK